jgi:hypothetical protein
MVLAVAVNLVVVKTAAAAPPAKLYAAPNIQSLATVSIAAVADSYVGSDSPSINYGTATQLRADGSPIVNSYLRFAVQGLSGSVTSATLRVYANSSSSTGYNVAGVSSNTWGEKTITYSNAPPVGSTLGKSGAFSAGVWTNVNVTAYVTGNGSYNMAIVETGSTAVSFASREAGANAPQLVVVAGGVSSTATPTPVGGKSPTPTPIKTTTPTQAATTSGSVVMVGAGDISDCGNNNDEATAKLVDNIGGTVFTAGDNVYTDGTYTQFVNCYNPTWGRSKSRTDPSPGNHDYNTGGAAGYFQYFNNVPAYYAYNLGSWRIYSLNSEISVSATSPQVTWLKADLAANPKLCVMAYWHKPRFSSGSTHGSNSSMQTLWSVLDAAGADLVINGHEHNYERFAEMNASGAAVSPGLREIVVGTGGESHYAFGSALAASQVRNGTTYGVIKLTLSSTGYTWQFVPVAGSTFTDSGSSNCH